MALLSSLLILAAGGWIGANLGQQFFPKDLSYLAYINIWLPEDSSFDSTNDLSAKTEQLVARVAAEQKIRLHSVNSYIGGAAPRFWYSLAPEPNHKNFAQIVVFAEDKHELLKLLPLVRARASHEIAGAIVDVMQLETGDAVGIPIQIRISGDHFETLRHLADNVKDLLRANPIPGHPDSRRLGRRPLQRSIGGRPGPRQPRGHEQLRRGIGLHFRHERHPGNRSARRQQANPGDSQAACR